MLQLYCTDSQDLGFRKLCDHLLAGGKIKLRNSLAPQHVKSRLIEDSLRTSEGGGWLVYFFFLRSIAAVSMACKTFVFRGILFS